MIDVLEPGTGRRRACLLITLVAATAILGAACSRRPSLEVITAGGDGPPTLVLLHGFGSSAEDWMQFTRTLDWPLPGRFVFPQAPSVTPAATEGTFGRAWWPLELFTHIPAGQDMPDLSRTRPPGLEVAAGLVVSLLRSLARSTSGPIVLGGFSQGAMVASEVAFRTRTPLAGLVLLSGTPVDEGSWQSGYSTRRGLPVFMAHGRRDTVLPFAGSERMRRDLERAGVDVTWHPFEDGHEIPAEVIVDLNRFLSRLRAGSDRRDGPAQ